MKNTFKNFEEYFLPFPEKTQQKLEKLREFIHSIHSDLEEYISYQMPAFKYNKKPLVYFAAYKNHVGFYPLPEAIKHFENDFKERKKIQVFKRGGSVSDERRFTVRFD